MMKVRNLVALVALVAIAVTLAGLPSCGEDASVPLGGVVIDARDGRPVSGARVVVVLGGMEGLGSRWTTDGSSPLADVVVGDDGRFAVRVPRNETVTATASAEGFSDDGRTVRVGASEPSIELRLAPGGRLNGVVRGPDGAGVADAWVYAIPAHMPELLDLPDGWVDRGGRRWTAVAARTRADGRYQMSGLHRGAVYIALAKAVGWARSERRDAVFVSDAESETLADFSLRSWGSVVVHVGDAHGAPVRASVDLAAGEGQSEDDINVQWSDPQDIQDDATRFRRLVPGVYWVSAGDTVSLRKGPRTSVVISAGQTTEVTLRQERPVAI